MLTERKSGRRFDTVKETGLIRLGAKWHTRVHLTDINNLIIGIEETRLGKAKRADSDYQSKEKNVESDS
jgi:hypothetical protein